MSRPPIYAVDFDGTLCRNMWPAIGDPNWELIEWLIAQQQVAHAQVILYTMRENELLEEAIAWCKEYGLEFAAVNENLPSQQEYYGNNPRKIYADIYFDDHNWSKPLWPFSYTDTVTTNLYNQEDIYPNCTVQVLTNTYTGDVSVGWWPNEEIEEGKR